MQKLILILGELAAGKSTLAYHISDRYHIPALTKDHVKEFLCDHIGYSGREENLKLSHLSFDILRLLFEFMAESKRDVILESNFRQHELDMLKEAASRYNYEVLTIFLTGDLKVLHQRYIERSKSGLRHPGHLTQNLDDFENFNSVSCSANPRSLFGSVITIDTTLPGTPFDLSSDERIRSFIHPVQD